MTLTLVTLISVICNTGMVRNEKECVSYMNKCIKETIQSEYYEQYTKEFKKSHAFYYCGLRGGYIK